MRGTVSSRGFGMINYDRGVCSGAAMLGSRLMTDEA